MLIYQGVDIPRFIDIDRVYPCLSMFIPLSHQQFWMVESPVKSWDVYHQLVLGPESELRWPFGDLLLSISTLSRDGHKKAPCFFFSFIHVMSYIYIYNVNAMYIYININVTYIYIYTYIYI